MLRLSLPYGKLSSLFTVKVFIVKGLIFRNQFDALAILTDIKAEEFPADKIIHSISLYVTVDYGKSDNSAIERY